MAKKHDPGQSVMEGLSVGTNLFNEGLMAYLTFSGGAGGAGGAMRAMGAAGDMGGGAVPIAGAAGAAPAVQPGQGNFGANFRNYLRQRMMMQMMGGG
jgi:hypothetical protein